MAFDESKAVYQLLCKLLHPDAAPADKRVEFTRRMQEVNKAYATGDLKTLKRIATGVLGEQDQTTSTPPSSKGDLFTGPFWDLFSKENFSAAKQKAAENQAKRAKERDEKNAQSPRPKWLDEMRERVDQLCKEVAEERNDDRFNNANFRRVVYLSAHDAAFIESPREQIIILLKEYEELKETINKRNRPENI